MKHTAGEYLYPWCASFVFWQAGGRNNGIGRIEPRIMPFPSSAFNRQMLTNIENSKHF